jgi:hypothetical protein
MSLEFKLSEKRNLGKSKNNNMPKLWKYLIIVPDNFELAAADIATEASLKTAIQTAIKAAIQSRAYLFPPIFKTEDLSDPAVYDKSVLGINDVFDGLYAYKFHFAENMFTHKSLQSHYYKNEGRGILVDFENRWMLTEKSNSKLTGATIQFAKAEKTVQSDGSKSTTSPYYLVLSDPKDWDVRGRLIEGGSVITELDPLTDVEIVLAADDAFDPAGFEVDVRTESDETPVSGLVLADFKLYAADGVTLQTINTAAEDANIPGRYNLLPPGGNPFEDGTLTLRAPSLLTVAAGAYENPTRLQLAVDV